METEKLLFILAVVYLNIIRQVTGTDAPEEQLSSSYLFDSVELSFWIALGLASSVIITCLCCIFCCKRNSLLSRSAAPSTSQQVQVREGQANSGFDYSDPPPPYYEALKYALNKDIEGLPEYSETYL
nr:uncharacterized protein LOC129280564 [Lytechinus pictus]